MRLALTEKQHRQLEQAVVSFPHRVQLFQGVDLDHILGWNSSAISGLLLKDACTIHTGEYIRGLFQLCMQLGRVEWRPEIVRHVEDLKQTNEFQDIVFCTGADINFIGGISGHVSITRSFGRNFYYHQGETNLPLKVPIICGRYLIPGKTTFIAGATFEGDSCLSDQLAQDMQISDVQSRLDKLVPGIFNHLQFIHMDVRTQNESWDDTAQLHIYIGRISSASRKNTTWFHSYHRSTRNFQQMQYLVVYWIGLSWDSISRLAFPTVGKSNCIP